MFIILLLASLNDKKNDSNKFKYKYEY